MNNNDNYRKNLRNSQLTNIFKKIRIIKTDICDKKIKVKRLGEKKWGVHTMMKQIICSMN